MKVIYSIGSKFGGHGIGGVAVRAVRGIYKARALRRVLASYQGEIPNFKSPPFAKASGGRQILNSKTRIPKRYVKTMGLLGIGLRRIAYWDQTGWGYVLHDNVFDRWAVGQLGACDIFHGWNHHCLRQIRRIKKDFKRMKRETVTVVERASSHILQSQEILKEEYKKYDVNVRLLFAKQIARSAATPLPQVYVEKCLAEYEEADYILVPSDYARRSFLERGFDEKKIVKVPFGVDAKRFKIPNIKYQISNQYQMTNDKSQKFIVLYVGEIRLGKGVQYLLEAWGKLRLKDAELWLVGEVKRDIRKLVTRNKKQETVKFLGFRRDVAELMGKASVFAFPSLDEGSARVTYEAMAAGLPVVTTPNAGSLVRDSLDGYIIPIRDSESLAERIEFFYKYPEQAGAMGKSGRERIKEFTWERYGEELVKAYVRMLKY